MCNVLQDKQSAMDLDQTQAIAIDYEYDDDETDDETTSEAGKRPVRCFSKI